ncbi:MAG: hypothetical protein ACJARY_001487 [Candidatus Azotimanducaceae bacterium]|jgi:hypothetical protein
MGVPKPEFIKIRDRNSPKNVRIAGISTRLGHHQTTVQASRVAEQFKRSMPSKPPN